MKNGERKKQEMQSTLSLSLSMSFAVSESQFLHELCDTRVRSFPFVKLNSQYDALKYLRQVKPINTQHLVYNTFLGWARKMVEFFNTQCNTNPDKKNIGEPPPNSRQKQTVHWTLVEIQHWKWNATQLKRSEYSCNRWHHFDRMFDWKSLLIFITIDSHSSIHLKCFQIRISTLIPKKNRNNERVDVLL